MLVLGFVALVRLIGQARGAPRATPRPSATDRFTLALTSTELTCTGATMKPITVPTGEIAEIVGGARLGVVMNDNTTLTLPCRLTEPAETDHAEFV